MKRMYWKSQKVTRPALLAVAVLAIVGLSVVELMPRRVSRDMAEHQRQAANIASNSFAALKKERLRRGIELQPEFDPGRTGLIGSPLSPVTTKPADLGAKRTAINPNFASLVVSMFYEAGVQPGDTVAIGWSGSFPGFNVAVCAAMEAMQLRPVIVASATSSQYGANFADWMWIDMEGHLADTGLISFRSHSISPGGAADRLLGMPEQGQALIAQAIKRNRVEPLKENRLAASIDRRMRRYRALAGSRPIKAYVNVGGGIASTGGQRGKAMFQPGLNIRHVDSEVDCVMARFARQRVPVVHLIEARYLAERHGLPVAPTEMPTPGSSQLVLGSRYNRPLAGLTMGLLLASAWYCFPRRGLEI